MIKVYSTSWCGFCHAAKQYFDRLGVKYDDVNVEQDRNAAEEMVRKSGQMGVPVIDIEGELVIGFDKPKIDMLLKAKNLA